MRRAIDLAWRGWGRVAPNPLVGAVVLRHARVAGEGWHAEFGGPHAEIGALGAAGEAARGATLVVTLEPCAHHGKTPPCTDAILAAGVTRVVCASRDPDARARGGLEVLRAAGVAVAAGLLEADAAAQNASFFFSRARSDRPFIALKLATSIDGRIADRTGQSRWISGDAARDWVHWLRAGFDALAVGGVTVLTDDPQLTVRGAVTPRRPPVRVVFDRRAMLNAGVRLVATARETPTWVVASPAAPAANVAVLEANGVRVLRPADLAEGLAAVRGEGIRSLLCEGGGALGARLLGLVDRLYWVPAPVGLGGDGVLAFPEQQGVLLAEVALWVPVERRTLAPD